MTITINPDIALLPFEKELEKLYTKANSLFEKKRTPANEAAIIELQKEIDKKIKLIYKKLDNWDITQVARHPNRPYSLDYFSAIFDDFIEIHGDRVYRDDPSTVCGIANFKGQSVVLVGQQKGRDTQEKLFRNFGFPQPEGYRKALRVFKMAEKFNKPIITFIDTPGAFPGIEAEEHGQGEAIARNLREMAGLTVPVISVVIGEGGSGGALGIGVSNYISMLEYSIYSVISPEPCASILWHDPEEKVKAANALKNDAITAKKFGIVDEIIPEPVGGAHRDWETTIDRVEKSIEKGLALFSKMTPTQLVQQRIKKFENIGVTVKI